MSVYYKTGDLLKSDCTYLCHQVNCQARMGSGIAKSIKERWSAVYDMYMQVAAPNMLGHIQTVFVQGDNISVQGIINMFGQEYYGYDGKRYTSYDAFWSCLGEIKDKVKKGSKIGFPAKIGCGLGGANWEVIKTMIEQALGADYEVYIYTLEVEL